MGVGPLRVAVVGSGPAGFYTADCLLSADVQVDLLERLPTPWGLVRLGVAPDHPELKAASRVFEKTAAKEGFRFFGNVEVGRDVTHAELTRLYDAVVYTVGAQTDRRLGIPGEDLSKVKHYYHEAHPFFGLDVVVIGGKNSAAIAALDLWRHGAKVTLVHRGAEMHRHVKYWILPDINNRVKNGEIQAYFDSNVTNISEDDITIATPEGEVTIANQFCFALTGYHPDFSFIERLGVKLDEANDRCPVCDPATLESNVPGIYLAGVIVAGERTNEIFIENGRFHGKLIAEDLLAKRVMA